MADEKEKQKAPDKPKEWIPRRLKVVTGGPRGPYLADADTGEDLRLSAMSFNVELSGTGNQANVHATFHVVAVEKEKR